MYTYAFHYSLKLKDINRYNELNAFNRKYAYLYLFIFIFINVSVLVSLRAPRLIPRVLKLMTM